MRPLDMQDLVSVIIVVCAVVFVIAGCLAVGATLAAGTTIVFKAILAAGHSGFVFGVKRP